MSYSSSSSITIGINHRHNEVAVEFRQELDDACDTLVDLSGAKWASIDAFLAALETDDAAELVKQNTSALKAIYTTTMKKYPARGITPTNLSSLTLFSRSISLRDARPFLHYDDSLGRWRLAVSSSLFKRSVPCDYDGWMLTGDLELTDAVWGAFYRHYFVEMSLCVAVNVPHHGSAIAMHDEAIHHLGGGRFFLFPVNADDAKHPAPELTVRMQKYEVTGQHSVTAAPESQFSLTSTW